MQVIHLPKALFVTPKVAAKVKQMLVERNTDFLTKFCVYTRFSEIYFPP